MTLSQSPLLTFQSLAVPSMDPVTSCAPSGEKASEHTLPRWPLNSRRHSPSATRQSLAVRSMEHVASRAPERSNATARTEPRCPRRVSSRGAAGASERRQGNGRHRASSVKISPQSFATPASDPVASIDSSGLKVMDQMVPVWLGNTPRRSRLCALQMFPVRSHEPVANHAPSGEHATELTGPSWPWKVCSKRPLGMLQRLAVPSMQPVSSSRPLGEKATDMIAP
mmetsp:Transcript_77984/g.206967  ORF Transcript_77984/g.206967 Transcript_77984/m.206967 type:complete len:225 (-) Transcript_77984:124-798(-)